MASDIKYKLILASGSPRRKELLSWLDIPFEIIKADIEEHSEELDSVLFAEDIAKQKGNEVFKILKKDKNFGNTLFPFVISSDTIVCLGKKIFGKPKNRDDARIMLKELSGKTHLVITSVSFSYNKFDGEEVCHTFSGKTMVTFENITEDILENYLLSDESLDKAGAYGIQGRGLSFISNIEGSYSNVVGFPLSDVVREMKSTLGFSEDNTGEWRKLFLQNISQSRII
jgi:septum formation protein